MRYKTVVTVFVCLALVSVADVSALTAQERQAQVALQQALQVERVQGDLERAIGLYQDLISQHGDVRAVAAKALLQLGECYEKLGRAEATNAYQRLVREYGDQSQLASQARARLAALQAQSPAARGPVARRLLSGEETDVNNFFMMVPSPDGRRVAFVDLDVGAVHVRDLASGTEEVLVPGLPAWNWAPTWSPDGARIAFAKANTETGDETIAIIDLRSRAVTTVPGTRDKGTIRMLTWSHDGRFLLYRATRGRATSPGGEGEIGLVAVDGGARRALVDSAKGGSLSPDGQYIAYAMGPLKSEQIFVQPVSGGERRQITTAPGGNTDPLWSPDGSGIAYQRSDGVWVVPIASGDAGGTPRLAFVTAADRFPVAWNEVGGLYLAQISDVPVPVQLGIDPATGTPTGAIEELEHHPSLAHWFAWSPDRQRIAFVVTARGWEVGGASIAVYAVDGSITTSHEVAAETERISSVGWSTDGREVLFASGRAEDGTTLRALDLSTGLVRDLFPRSHSRVPYDISADGRHTLFLDATPDDSRSGWVVAETGQTGGRLVVPAHGTDGSISPNVAQLSPRGDRLLFVRRRSDGEPETLWVVATDGTSAHQVGTAQFIRSAVWDPSGRLVAYTADSKTMSALRIVDVAAGAVRDVSLPKGRLRELRVTDWSRDGGRIGFVGQAYHAEYWAIQGLLESQH